MVGKPYIVDGIMEIVNKLLWPIICSHCIPIPREVDLLRIAAFFNDDQGRLVKLVTLEKERERESNNMVHTCVES